MKDSTSGRRAGSRRVLLLVRGVAGALLVLTLSYSIVYWAAAFLRGGMTTAAAYYGYYLLVFAVGLLVSIGALYLFGKFFGEQQQAIFHTLSDAMRRIAAGDFDVTVPVDKTKGTTPSGTSRAA